MNPLKSTLFFFVFFFEFLQKRSFSLEHAEETVCLALESDGMLYAVGSQSHVSLYDVRSDKPVDIIGSNDPGAGVRSLSFRNLLLTVGTGLGSLSFFDLRTGSYLKHSDNNEKISYRSGKGWLVSTICRARSETFLTRIFSPTFCVFFNRKLPYRLDDLCETLDCWYYLCSKPKQFLWRIAQNEDSEKEANHTHNVLPALSAGKRTWDFSQSRCVLLQHPTNHTQFRGSLKLRRKQHDWSIKFAKEFCVTCSKKAWVNVRIQCAIAFGRHHWLKMWCKIPPWKCILNKKSIKLILKRSDSC